jgi:hypothetical protein
MIRERGILSLAILEAGRHILTCIPIFLVTNATLSLWEHTLCSHSSQDGQRMVMSEASDVCSHVDTFFVACNKRLEDFFFSFFPGTMVCKLDTFEKNPLLEVDSSDLCVAHLRPDFVDDIYFPSSDNEDYDYADDMYDWGNYIFGYI